MVGCGRAGSTCSSHVTHWHTHRPLQLIRQSLCDVLGLCMALVGLVCCINQSDELCSIRRRANAWPSWQAPSTSSPRTPTARPHLMRLHAVTSGNASKDQKQDEQVRFPLLLAASLLHVCGCAQLHLHLSCCGQVQRLRDAAQARYDHTIERIDSGPGLQSSSSSQNGSQAELQLRLEGAIRSLQEGLVERDTEACILQPPM